MCKSMVIQVTENKTLIVISPEGLAVRKCEVLYYQVTSQLAKLVDVSDIKLFSIAGRFSNGILSYNHSLCLLRFPLLTHRFMSLCNAIDCVIHSLENDRSLNPSL